MSYLLKIKKIIYLSVFFIGSLGVLPAQSIDINTAKIVAENFYNAHNQRKSKGSLSLYCAKSVVTTQKSSGNSVYYYIFNDENDSGFVLVAGDKRVEPILGYSTEGKFDTTGMPDNLRYWLKGYEEEINYAIANFEESTQEIAEKWDGYIKNIPTKTRKTIVVGPLVQTKWGQDSPYNNLCPYDYNARQRAVTGCVATAMAQIMKYWGYPIVGNGSHSYTPYTHSDYGTLSANFANTNYKWSSMPNTLTNSSSSVEKESVATLMYHCGVAVEMDYSPTGSGAFTYLSDYDIQRGYMDARTALNSFFRCIANGHYRSSYTYTSWISLLKNELNNARPILYSGEGPDVGHAFVCDGYNDNYGDYFHFNWGWNGQDDGYFLTNALNVANSNFNSSQDIVTINPNGCVLRFYNNITLSQNLVYRNTPFSVSALIANYGGASFSGSISFDIYDATGNYMGEVGSMDRNLASLTYGNTNANSTGVNYPAGTYYLTAWYKENNSSNWIQVREGTAPNFYSQWLQFQIKDVSKVNMQLAEHIYITPTTVYLGDILTVIAKITNSGDKTFNGKIGLDVYNISGEYVATLTNQTKSIASATQQNISGTNTNVFYPAGRYYVVATYTEQDSTKKIISGTGGISNRTYFEVKSNVSVEENLIEQAIVYPNPSSDKFIFKTPELLENAVAEIFDITGKSLYKTIIDDKETVFDVSSFNSGIYYLNVSGKDIFYTYKLVKQ